MRIRLLAAGVAGVAYVLASHWLMTRAPASSWSALAIVGPMLALAGFLAWQRGQRLLAALALLATAALAWHAWRGGGLAPGSIDSGAMSRLRASTRSAAISPCRAVWAAVMG